MDDLGIASEQIKNNNNNNLSQQQQQQQQHTMFTQEKKISKQTTTKNKTKPQWPFPPVLAMTRMLPVYQSVNNLT